MKNIYHNICRFCLYISSDLLSVFEDTNIIKAITACTNIKILDNDDNPKNICPQCMERLNDAFKFKQQCETSDSLLKESNELVFNYIKNINKFPPSTQSPEKEYIVKNIDEQFEIIYKIEDDQKYYTPLDYIKIENENSEEIANIEKESCDSNESIKNIHSGRNDFKKLNIDKKKIITGKSYQNSSQSTSEEQKIQIIEKIPELNNTITRIKSVYNRDQKLSILKGFKKTQCDICYKKFSTIGNLNKHKKIHCDFKPYNCPKCSKAFLQSSSLKYHMDVHLPPDCSPHRCNQCDFSTRRLSTLEKHIAITHMKKIPQRYLKGAIPAMCKICNKVLSSEKSLGFHMKIHENIREYICKYCGKDFIFKSGLESHERIHTNEKPFKCEFCDKSFRQKMGLHVHKRLHTGEKPYQCQICSKTFCQISHLRSHLFTHTGEKKYECNVCNKKFSLSEGLRYHKMTHTGESPHKCKLCDRGFKIPYKLKHHMEKCHHIQITTEEIKNEL